MVLLSLNCLTNITYIIVRYRIKIQTLFAVLIFIVLSISAYSQEPDLPFYYEKNLPLYGHPPKVEEYYYEYHTQTKAHYYNHFIEFDAQGRVKKHVKTNVGLLDDVPPIFQSIIDPRPVTITCSFEYDENNRLVYFVRNQQQTDVDNWRQDEEWIYDTYGALKEHNFWDVSEGQRVIKNPSIRWKYQRNDKGQVVRVEKQTYSFSAGDLALSEITEFGYKQNVLDTISVYRVLNGNASLRERRSQLSFHRYNDLIPDSILLSSFVSIFSSSDTILQTINYDGQNRKLASYSVGTSDDTISHIEWEYDEFSVKQTSNNIDRLEVYYDETGYEKYREEFQNNQSLAVPADLNTRVLENGKMVSALREIWDPVTYFYRKDTEYLYFYDITSLSKEHFSSDMIAIYPNPGSGTFYLNDPDDISELTLYATDGKLWKLSPGASITSECPAGIYLLVIKMKDGSIEKTRLVIE
ncbi:T9SS type A sorting domain-containing protein [Sporocytophaga myxococcoides]|uniref:T9SS type A sorting domain-containing protein n=1 Tax=Sporocytophaga myxococcoides TaxID=153721 RepID=UPI0003FCD225|nr:T9SS type A sorting domain-containing protein [Sporocytophaga myxococcoides]